MLASNQVSEIRKIAVMCLLLPCWKIFDAFAKANRQIKETKKYFDAPDAKGLLLLVNDGNYMLTPAMMKYLLSRSLPKKYSGINSAIYISVNEELTTPGNPGTSWFLDRRSAW